MSEKPEKCSHARKWKIGKHLFISSLILVVWGNPASAFCMNDQELRYALQSAYVFGVGQMLGICARRYQSLKNKAIETVVSFLTTYQPEIKQVENEATAAFEKFYPGRGAEEKNQNNLLANQEDMNEVESYDEKQCEDSIRVVEALIRVDNWPLASTAAFLTYEQARANVPQCP